MASGEREARESRAAEPELITDPQLKAEAEAANGLRQYDYAVKSVYEALERQPFKLRVSRITSFQREALQGISPYAGLTRPGGIEIKGSKHQPPDAHLMQELLEDLCDYVNDHWDATAIPPGRLCDVASELDSSICGRERPNVANSVVFRPVGETRLCAARNADLPGTGYRASSRVRGRARSCR
jgi:hypothetical protein